MAGPEIDVTPLQPTTVAQNLADSVVIVSRPSVAEESEDCGPRDKEGILLVLVEVHVLSSPDERFSRRRLVG